MTNKFDRFKLSMTSVKDISEECKCDLVSCGQNATERNMLQAKGKCLQADCRKECEESSKEQHFLQCHCDAKLAPHFHMITRAFCSALCESKFIEGAVDKTNSMCALCKTLDLEKKFEKCGRCKKVIYCDKSCQKKHWKEHKKECEPHLTADEDFMRILTKIAKGLIEADFKEKTNRIEYVVSIKRLMQYVNFKDNEFVTNGLKEFIDKGKDFKFSIIVRDYGTIPIICSTDVNKEYKGKDLKREISKEVKTSGGYLCSWCNKENASFACELCHDAFYCSSKCRSMHRKSDHKNCSKDSSCRNARITSRMREYLSQMNWMLGNKCSKLWQDNSQMNICFKYVGNNANLSDNALAQLIQSSLHNLLTGASQEHCVMQCFLEKRGVGEVTRSIRVISCIANAELYYIESVSVT